MKKLLLTLALAGSISSALAQGTIVYYNRVANSVIAPVYGPEVIPSTSLVGNTSAGFAAGTQTYAGAALAGTGFTASLWSGASGSTAEQLVLVPLSFKGFRTGAGAGLIDNQGQSITIPNVADGLSAALQLRVWDNRGGTITSWDQVVADGSILRGLSPVFNSLSLGGGQVPPPNMNGLQSFNVYVVPEPSTFVLAGLGAAALMIIRRRK